MSMEVHIRLFAMQRQQLGWRDRPLELPEASTIGDAWRALVTSYPVLGDAGGSIRFARNGAYADINDRLADGDELALIPPVAGGSLESYRRIELWPEPFPNELVLEVRRAVSSSADGAVVVFLGQTRESAGTPAPGQEPAAASFAGRPVLRLEYEAFETMALSILDAIADEVEAHFGVRRLVILHRTGEVPLETASVLIAVAAEHRGAAFDACRYAIDELKARAPIWKLERFADGGIWIGEPPRSGPVER
jgi:molybdopterin synthase catalytic subunit/molybdopterin converting factor small subunit